MRGAALPLAALLLAGCEAARAPDAPPVASRNEGQSTAAPLPRDGVAPATEHSTATAGRLRADVSALEGSVGDLRTRVTALGTIVDLPSDTLFAFDTAELTPAAEAVLQKAVRLVRAAPPGPVRLIGHSDSIGEDGYNQALSLRRAQAVAAWLSQVPGVRQRETRAEGRGESAPLEPNSRPDGSDNPEGRARNRRVELVLPAAPGDRPVR